MVESTNIEEVEVEHLIQSDIRSSTTWRRKASFGIAISLLALMGLVGFVGLGGRTLSFGNSGMGPGLSSKDTLNSEANYAKAIQLLARVANSSSFLHGAKEVARAHAAGTLPEVHYPNFNDTRELHKFWTKAQAAPKKESRTDLYLRVSVCMASVSLAGLKLASAILALDAAIDVCPKVEKFRHNASRHDKVHWRTARVADRRLAAGVVFAAGVSIDSLKQAMEACSANINGILSGLTAVSQYIAGSINSCPEYLNPIEKRQAGCTDGISVLISGLTKSAASLSDIQYQCRDPNTTAYASPIDQKRKPMVTAACIVSVGQATAYVGKVGLEINGLVENCRREDIEKDFYLQAACAQHVGANFANIGQVATYLAAAANGCGPMILNPFGCSNRVAATVTGFADVVEGSGKIIVNCVPRPLPPR